MSYSELKSNAEREARTRFPRALVQLGGCTRTVGAGAVLSLLQATVAKKGLMTPVRVAGCDGACHEAPVVIVEMSEGLTYRLTNVGPADVNSILSFWLAGLGDPSSTWKGKPVLWPPPGDLPGFWKGQERRVMEHVGAIEPGNIDDYVAHGGYAVLNEVLHSMTPEQVVEEVVRADLRGRGGAYFPAGRKWQGARAAGPGPRYLIVNAEEGEPGIYKDRHVMEGSPFLLLEGLAIAAYAIGAEKTYLYVNGEANAAAGRIENALEQARNMGLAGDGVLGSDFNLDIEVRRGGGGYILGEESALMNSIEGQRNVPRTKPPFPVESGLWGKPTVINNVETLCNLPMLLSDVGAEPSPGTKLVSLSGRVRRPGLVEVPMGATVREIVFDIGGGPPEGSEVIGVVAGGPSGGLLNESMLDVPIGPGMLDPEGAVLGSGGITVLDTSVSPVEVVRRLAAYNAAESCSKCTPCREGTKRMLDLLGAVQRGEEGRSGLEKLAYLNDVVGFGSLCGLGQMAPGPVRSGLAHFKEAFEGAVGVGRGG